jgi:hypothetical protein
VLLAPLAEGLLGLRHVHLQPQNRSCRCLLRTAIRLLLVGCQADKHAPSCLRATEGPTRGGERGPPLHGLGPFTAALCSDVVSWRLVCMKLCIEHGLHPRLFSDAMCYQLEAAGCSKRCQRL